MDIVHIAALTIHDVKNRLAILAGQSEAAGDLKSRNALIESADALSRLLTLFKAESGLLRLEQDADSPADLLAELAAIAQPTAEFTIVTEAQAAPTLWFYDKALVRMVLNNALNNAMRHARSQIV